MCPVSQSVEDPTSDASNQFSSIAVRNLADVSVHELSRTHKRGSRALLGALATAGIGVVVAIVIFSTPLLDDGMSVGSTEPPMASQMPLAETSPAGISEAQAIEIARSHVESDAVLLQTALGGYGEVTAELIKRPSWQPPPLADELDPSTLVWGIQFTVLIEICPPQPHPCFTPRPAYRTVILDAVTGERIITSTYSPEK
jgi:hypothetical protein